MILIFSIGNSIEIHKESTPYRENLTFEKERMKIANNTFLQQEHLKNRLELDFLYLHGIMCRGAKLFFFIALDEPMPGLILLVF